MPELTFEVVCGTCGNGLCNITRVESGRWGHTVSVEACPKCLDKARDEGYDSGYDKGVSDGRNEE